MITSTHIKSLFKLTLITVIIYLTFKYALPLLYPFVFSYILIKLLYPTIQFLQRHTSLPLWYIKTAVLSLLGTGIIFIIMIVCRKIFRQLQLLLTNLGIYSQIYSDMVSDIFQKCCHHSDNYLSLDSGETYQFLTKHFHTIKTDYSTKIIDLFEKILSSSINNVISFFITLVFFVVSLIMFCKDLDSIEKKIKNSSLGSAFLKIRHSIKCTGYAYIKSQAIIIMCNWIACSISLFLIHNPYYILLGLTIAVVDALPVLGSGFFLVPMGIWHIYKSNFYAAAILFTAYVATIFIRELLEARLMSNSLGISPILTLISIYIGVKLFGVAGILLGPLSFITIDSINNNTSFQ